MIRTVTGHHLGGERLGVGIGNQTHRAAHLRAFGNGVGGADEGLHLRGQTGQQRRFKLLVGFSTRPEPGQIGGNGEQQVLFLERNDEAAEFFGGQRVRIQFPRVETLLDRVQKIAARLGKAFVKCRRGFRARLRIKAKDHRHAFAFPRLEFRRGFGVNDHQ